VLFSGTIATNIAYGRPDATPDQIVEAARAANAHEFISALPDGYEAILGERGSKLSGGERQRISVARAFLKNAPILLLDEPTSSIDTRTEEVILDALDRLMLGRTTFIIAHRLSTIRRAQLVLVIDKGALVESGSLEELMSRDGPYRRLYELQTRRRRAVVAPAGI
jgi:ABC-type multidrug transport system fused ATPase/permease subunit